MEIKQLFFNADLLIGLYVSRTSVNQSLNKKINNVRGQQLLSRLVHVQSYKLQRFACRVLIGKNNTQFLER